MANIRALSEQESVEILCKAMYGEGGPRYHENMRETVHSLAQHGFLMVHMKASFSKMAER